MTDKRRERRERRHRRELVESASGTLVFIARAP
jgi:hypothetical protein